MSTLEIDHCGTNSSAGCASSDAPADTPLTVRSVELRSVSSSDLGRWCDLLERASDPNPFLAPCFVLPLIQHLKASTPLSMLVVESAATGQWMAAGVFETNTPVRWWSPAYARSLSSPYSFLNGLLVDVQAGAAAIATMFESQSHRRDWHGLHFGAVRGTSKLSRFLDTAAARAGVRVFRCREWLRACYLNRGPQATDDILADCSKVRRKSLRRCRKRLEALGDVHFQLVVPDNNSSPAVETFLRLEQLGWKGEAGTAIASHPDHEAFFRQMIAGFAQDGSILFGELLLNGVPIASTCNLRHGSLLCAFKIGWDPAYSEAGLGYWSEVELASAISQQKPDIARIDSSAKFGSYVESVWHEREPMMALTYTWSARGMAAEIAQKYLRLFKQSCQRQPVAAAS